MRYKYCLVVISLLLSSCAHRPNSDYYLSTHPEFELLEVGDAHDVIQLTWYVSWKPLVHLRLSEKPTGALLEYSVSNKYVKSLRRKRISTSQWNRINDLLDGTDFWTGYGSCGERAFREDKKFHEVRGECEEVLVMDGAFVTIQAKKGNSVVGTLQWTGIPYIELSEFARQVLKIGNIEYR